MAYSDFLERLSFYKNQTVQELLDDPSHRYAVQCRERGSAYVDRIRKLFTTPLEQTVIMDVGCAYGGISIELAKAGANAYGIEIVPSYVDLARHNALNDAQANFVIGDLTLKSTLAEIQKILDARVDLFVINHVLEHIYDLEGLFQNLDEIASERSAVLFDVPNGFSVQSFVSEGHTGIFAVSLADPDCWHFFGNDRARIYYRRLEYFQSLFQAHGYCLALVREELKSREEMVESLREVMSSVDAAAEQSPAPPEIVKEPLARFKSEVVWDLTHASDDELDLKYFQYFWRGVAYRDGSSFEASYRDKIPPPVWGDL